MLHANDFISAKEFEEKILTHHVVEFSYQTARRISYHLRNRISIQKQQPAFNRQFDMLIRDLKALGKKRISIVSFCGKSKTTGKASQHFY